MSGWRGDYCHVYIKLLISALCYIIMEHTTFSWALISWWYCGYTEEQIYWAEVYSECTRGKVTLSHCKRFRPTSHSAKRDQSGKWLFFLKLYYSTKLFLLRRKIHLSASVGISEVEGEFFWEPRNFWYDGNSSWLYWALSWAKGIVAWNLSLCKVPNFPGSMKWYCLCLCIRQLSIFFISWFWRIVIIPISRKSKEIIDQIVVLEQNQTRDLNIENLNFTNYRLQSWSRWVQWKCRHWLHWVTIALTNLVNCFLITLTVLG